jgi:predicted nucleic acid-binding protein
VSLYVDTSCFLKLVFSEPETLELTKLMSGEARIVVSALTRVEALVQIVGRVSGGAITRRAGAFAHRMVASLLKTAPFEPVDNPPKLVQIAQRQVLSAAGRAHCRTLDRLHLATMEGLELTRLLTNDNQQASAAQALGFDVIIPR